MNEATRSFIDANVPAIAAKVAAQVRSCIFGQPERRADDHIPIGKSKFGGRPDAPASFAWPMTAHGPCWFVAQLALGETHGLNLPREGLLSFFYEGMAFAPARNRKTPF